MAATAVTITGTISAESSSPDSQGGGNVQRTTIGPTEMASLTNIATSIEGMEGLNMYIGAVGAARALDANESRSLIRDEINALHKLTPIEREIVGASS